MADITSTKIFNMFYGFNQAVKAFFADFFSSIIFKTYLAANLFVLSVVWAVSYVINLKTNDDSFISLNYNVDFGVNLIGSAWIIYKLPLIGSAVMALNMILAGATYKRNRFAAHLLLISSVLANSVLLISTIMIYFINFR